MQMSNKLWFSSTTVTAVIIANMVGTGVFTSLGFQLLSINSTFAILMLWVLGGIIAFCGALCYAELGSIYPRSGGEYNFLSNIYHRSAGFVSGWVSASIGFAAPTALATITFATYLNAIIDIPINLCAALLVVALTLIHSTNHSSSGYFQTIFTAIKIIFIVVFSVLSLYLVTVSGQAQAVALTPSMDDIPVLTSGAFAVSLIYVSYAFTGWNAATYVSSELENPQRQLPKILLTGTLIVTLLYVLLNYVFLKVAPIDAMRGKVDIGYIAASYVLGDFGSKLMAGAMAVMLISTASAMIIAGPRVLQVMGEDFPSARALAVKNDNGIATRSIGFQCCLSLFFIATGSFDSILVFAGFTLGLNSLVTVLGLFIVRYRQSHNRPTVDHQPLFKVIGYPLPALIYLALSGWILGYILVQRPGEALTGLTIIAVGFAAYYLIQKFSEE